MADLDETETGKELSRPKFEFTGMIMNVFLAKWEDGILEELARHFGNMEEHPIQPI